MLLSNEIIFFEASFKSAQRDVNVMSCHEKVYHNFMLVLVIEQGESVILWLDPSAFLGALVTSIAGH